MERPITVPIADIVEEADGIQTIFLTMAMKAEPGQFVMIWLPGIDEKPFAISYLEGNRIGITVSAVGPFSKELCTKKIGDTVGIRGPYGTGYTIEGDKLVMVGGGYGTASLTLLAEQAKAAGKNVRMIIGAKTKNALVFEDRSKKLLGEENVFITTDDGSAGRAGFVTDELKEQIDADMVYACGPDKMMRAVADVCQQNNVASQVSMERWMKCGFGLCGHCSMDTSGVRVCVEGPVMSGEKSLELKEFGSYHRVKSSRKEQL